MPQTRGQPSRLAVLQPPYAASMASEPACRPVAPMLGFRCHSCRQIVRISLVQPDSQTASVSSQAEQPPISPHQRATTPGNSHDVHQHSGTSFPYRNSVAPLASLVSSTTFSEPLTYLRSFLSSRNILGLSDVLPEQKNSPGSSPKIIVETPLVRHPSHEPSPTDTPDYVHHADENTFPTDQILWLPAANPPDEKSSKDHLIADLSALERSMRIFQILRGDHFDQAIVTEVESAPAVSHRPPRLDASFSLPPDPSTDALDSLTSHTANTLHEADPISLSDVVTENVTSNPASDPPMYSSTIESRMESLTHALGQATLLCNVCLEALNAHVEELIIAYKEELAVYDTFSFPALPPSSIVRVSSANSRHSRSSSGRHIPISEARDASATRLPRHPPILARHSSSPPDTVVAHPHSNTYSTQSTEELDSPQQHIASNIQKLKRRIRRRTVQAKSLHHTVERLSDAYLEHQTTSITRNCSLASLESLTHYNSALLSPLSRYNVINDAFSIWADGPYGTINGLKLGKTPNDSVSWDEVNAAWGQTAFLLDSLIQTTLDIYHQRIRKKLQGKKPLPSQSSASTEAPSQPTGATAKPLQLDYLLGYRVLPRGNQSAILRRTDSTLFELYGNAGGLTRFFAARRFDSAMLIVLELVKDLIVVANFLRKHLAGKTEALIPPCEITKESVGGAPIRLPAAMGGEVWCRSLKSLLVNLKWLIGVIEGLHALATLAEEPTPMAPSSAAS